MQRTERDAAVKTPPPKSFPLSGRLMGRRHRTCPAGCCNRLCPLDNHWWAVTTTPLTGLVRLTAG